MTKRLVIARYNEDLTWLEHLVGHIDMFIYFKNDENKMNYDEKEVLCPNQFLLRNTGRESHTYLKHIVDNYNNLHDMEYFTQGRCDHINVENFKNFVLENDRDYKHVSDHGGFESIDGWITEHMKKEGYETRHIWDMLFSYDPPKKVHIKPHALFKVSRETIRMHDVSVYKKLLDLFSDNEVGNKNAWNLEYFWPLLFDKIHEK